MNVPVNTFKSKLKDARPQIGMWSTLCSNIVAEAVADAGFDWIVLDTEHTPNELPGLITQMQALHRSASSVIVRPFWNDKVAIKRLLDAGAQTLIIPFVQNAEEAKAAIAATRYPPNGIRGVTGSGRAAMYGQIKDYFDTAEEQLAVIVQLETPEALSNLEEIAAVEGVDAMFIGPADLSASMGHLGNSEHPEVQAAIKDGVERMKALNMPSGILAFNPEVAKRYMDWGFKFVAVGSDLSCLMSASKALVAKFDDR